jgi:hypothetical protein
VNAAGVADKVAKEKEETREGQEKPPPRSVGGQIRRASGSQSDGRTDRPGSLSPPSDKPRPEESEEEDATGGRGSHRKSAGSRRTRAHPHRRPVRVRYVSVRERRDYYFSITSARIDRG